MNGLPICGLLRNTFQLSTARALLCASTLKSEQSKNTVVSSQKLLYISVTKIRKIRVQFYREVGTHVRERTDTPFNCVNN